VLLGSRGLFSSVKDHRSLTANRWRYAEVGRLHNLRALNAAAARIEPEPPLLAMTAISKSFSGVPVLREVAFDLQPGEVHVLAGENGAGRATLMKIAAGVHTDYQGEIAVLASPRGWPRPRSGRPGISVSTRRCRLIDSMSVADNMFLGRELTRSATGGSGPIGAPSCGRRGVCEQLDLDIDLSRRRRTIRCHQESHRDRQGARLQRADLHHGRAHQRAQPAGVDKLSRSFLRQLKARGCGIIYITHRMEEIYGIADRITVLRDGRHVGTAWPRGPHRRISAPAEDPPSSQAVRRASRRAAR